MFMGGPSSMRLLCIYKQLTVSRTYQLWCFFLLGGYFLSSAFNIWVTSLPNCKVASQGGPQRFCIRMIVGVLNVDNKVSCHVNLLSPKCSMIYTLTLTVFTSPQSLNSPNAQPVGGLLQCQRSDLPFTSAIVPQHLFGVEGKARGSDGSCRSLPKL